MNEFLKLNESAEQLFRHGKQAFETTQRVAQSCNAFEFDIEEEIYTEEEERSCYNCVYRRWTKNSFACCRPKK